MFYRRKITIFSLFAQIILSEPKFLYCRACLAVNVVNVNFADEICML